MNYYVYTHTREDTGAIFYIGVGTKSNHKPDNPYHRSKVRHGRNRIWKAIVLKTDYKIDVLSEFQTYEQALDEEMRLIKQYGRICTKEGTLANIGEGGRGTLNLPRSEETKVKLSIALKGRKVSKETLAKITLTKRTDVYQYTYEGELVKHFDSIQKCIESNPSFISSTLRAACSGLRESAYSYQWRHGYNNVVSTYFPNKVVLKKDAEGNILDRFGSVKECSSVLNIGQSHVYTIIKRNQTYRNYLLQYENL